MARFQRPEGFAYNDTFPRLRVRCTNAYNPEETATEVFVLMRSVPLAVAEDFAALGQRAEDGTLRISEASVTKMVRAVMVAEDRDRWDSFIRDESVEINLQELFDALTDVVPLFTGGRPTSPVSGS